MVKLIVPILLIGLCFISDLYIFHRYIKTKSMWRWTWWLPLCIVIGFFIRFLFFNSGLENEYNITNIFLLIMGLVCIPKILFSLFSLIPKVGTYIGLLFSVLIIYTILYGITFGFSKIVVKHITFESPNVPAAFDGYTIAQFSDVHVGSFRGPYYHLLKESCDTINSLHPDLICFVGDIENFGPRELEQHKAAFSSLRAKDGVLSIMGNHDYSGYVDVTPAVRKAMVDRTMALQKSFGWDLLNNTHRIIHRGNDSIFIIGEENWGHKPFPQNGDVNKAIAGINPALLSHKSSDKGKAFSIMLSHDPNAWEEHILPVFRPDITLAGHTHGTQFSILGWSPSSMVYKEWGNAYYRNDNGEVSRENTSIYPTLLYVSTGFGGNFPFRFNMPREVVLITLKHK